LPLLTLAAASDRVRKKAISPVELTKACLQRIERLNPQLNAFVKLTAEAALSHARELEAEVRLWRKVGSQLFQASSQSIGAGSDSALQWCPGLVTIPQKTVQTNSDALRR